MLRIEVDLTEEAAAEMRRIMAIKGWDIATVLSRGFTLLRLYVQAEAQDAEMLIVDPKRPHSQAKVVIPE